MLELLNERSEFSRFNSFVAEKSLLFELDFSDKTLYNNG